VSPRFDLIVRNGTLVIPGVGTVAADIGICGGRIAAIGEKLSGAAQDVLDAGGKVVLPGLFDPHVHIGNELSFEQEAQSETRAAILGGVTTIGIMVRSLEDSYFLHLPAFRRAMDEISYVDSVFHLQIFTEQQIAEMPDYARQYGVRSFKFYMSGIPGIVNSVTDDVLFAGFKQAAAIGADVVACVHCETGALIERARNDLLARKPEGTLADWEDAHPAVAEALAIRTAAYLAKLAAVHLYVVHVSSRQGLGAVRAVRREGGRVTAETIIKRLDEFGEAYFRLAAIVQGVYKRGLDGNASSETATKYGNRARALADLAWSMVKLAAFWRGGNSLKVARNCATSPCAGMNR